MRYFLLTALVLMLGIPVYCQETSKKQVGKILKIKGRAYLKDPGQRSRKLTVRDESLVIFAEQELGCISKCSVTFSIGKTEKTITEAQGPYIIPNLLKRRNKSGDNIVVGTTRGPNDILLSPIERSIGFVRPDSLKFRWKIIKNGDRLINISPLTIFLYECKSAGKIWWEPNIDYSREIFNSEMVRNLLKERQKVNETTSIEVVLASESFPEKQRYCFDIISVSEERRLQDELKQWDNYDDLVRHTERAFIFDKYKLYSEAAEELEAALGLSLNNDYLLAETIRTYYKIGDTDRVNELLKRLRKVLPKSPLYEEMLALTNNKKH